MSRVFLDTVGLIARWDRDDQWHDTAKQAWLALVAERAEVVTTSAVLLECGNAAARRVYRTHVDDLRQVLERKQDVIHPTEEDWAQAWNAYRRGEADQAGIVDHVSFVVMRRLGLRQAFTNDRHFRAAGFELCF